MSDPDDLVQIFPCCFLWLIKSMKWILAIKELRERTQFSKIGILSLFWATTEVDVIKADTWMVLFPLRRSISSRFQQVYSTVYFYSFSPGKVFLPFSFFFFFLFIFLKIRICDSFLYFQPMFSSFIFLATETAWFVPDLTAISASYFSDGDEKLHPIICIRMTFQMWTQFFSYYYSHQNAGNI